MQQLFSGRGERVRGQMSAPVSHKYISSSSSSDGGGIFVCSGTARPYSLLAERQLALHSRLRLLWLRPENGHRASIGAPSADSESPLASARRAAEAWF